VTQGLLAVGGGGVTGNLTASVSAGVPLSVGGWSVTAAFQLAFGGTTATFTVQNGTVSVPGVGSLSIANGSFFASDGTGSLTILTPSPLHLGGSSSAFTATGSFTLSRLGSPVVTTLGATNVSVAWTGVTSFNVPSFSFGTDGHLDVNAQAKTITIGSFSLALPAFNVHVGPNGTGAELELESSSLTVPGVQTFTIPPVNVAVNGLFNATLAAGSFSEGSLTIAGRLVFERVVPSPGAAPVFRLSVLNLANGTVPKLTIPGLANLSLKEFSIASDSTFGVDVIANRIGPDALSIRNASVALKSPFTATLTGGIVNV
jgi:hypothetical protein